jgi:polysaccharide export outer membrane protein
MQKFLKRNLFLILIALISFSSCNINRDLMFKTKRDFEFDINPDKEDPEYRLAPNDLITAKIYSNDGFILIDMLAMMGGESSRQGQQQNQGMFMMQGNMGGIQYFIDDEGFAKLPIIGRVKLAGMTIWDAETFLEQEYAKFYVRPFAIVRVVNNRAFVFTGAGGSGTVVPILNNNTTLIEVLAKAGGLQGRANARRVKVFRQNKSGERNIYEVDLSTIEGIKYADMIIQANDIVYVEPMPFIVRQAAADLAPIVSVISSLTVIIAVLGTFNN